MVAVSKLKPGARNFMWVSHVGLWALELGPSPIAFPGTPEMKQLGLQLVPHGNWHLRLNPLHHSTDFSCGFLVWCLWVKADINQGLSWAARRNNPGLVSCQHWFLVSCRGKITMDCWSCLPAELEAVTWLQCRSGIQSTGSIEKSSEKQGCSFRMSGDLLPPWLLLLSA